MVSRSWDDLPREWLMADLALLRADEMKRLVAQAVEFGFDEPDDLSNQFKRNKWLRACREKAWDMLLAGGEPPAPGKAQPKDAKPKRAPTRPRRKPKPTAPRTPPKATGFDRQPAQDVFPPKGNRRRKPAPRRRVEADLCEIPAADCNEFLRSLPRGDED